MSATLQAPGAAAIPFSEFTALSADTIRERTRKADQLELPTKS